MPSLWLGNSPSHLITTSKRWSTLSDLPTWHLFGCAVTARTKRDDATLSNLTTCHLFGCAAISLIARPEPRVSRRPALTRRVHSRCTWREASTWQSTRMLSEKLCHLGTFCMWKEASVLRAESTRTGRCTQHPSRRSLLGGVPSAREARGRRSLGGHVLQRASAADGFETICECPTRVK